MTATFEILVSLAFAAGFFVLMLSGFTLIGSTGLAMCVLSAFFDCLPFSPMNGHEIFNFSKKIWVGLTASVLVLYVLWLIFL